MSKKTKKQKTKAVQKTNNGIGGWIFILVLIVAGVWMDSKGMISYHPELDLTNRQK